jgi:hypothetical protein
MFSRWTLNGDLAIRAMRRETLSYRREETESLLGLMDKASDFSSEDYGLESHRG